jgi:hypothetical protein
MRRASSGGAASLPPAVDVSPVSDEKNGYRALIVVYLVDNTVDSDADAPTFTVLEFTTPWRRRIFDQLVHRPS